MIPRKQFEQWLRHQIFMDIDGGACHKLVLKHVNSASRAGQVLLTIDVPSMDDTHNNDQRDAWVSDTIRLIEETTAGDAAGSGGTQTYALFAFHGGIDDKSSARFSIKMQGDPNLDDDEISSEPATKAGVVAQIMRHNEAIMRTAALQTSAVMQMMQRTTQQQAQIIEKLVEEKFNNISIVEQLLSQKNERDIETMREQKSMEMKEKAFDTLKLAVPTIMSKLLTAGKPPEAVAAPEAVKARDAQLLGLADTITSNQLEQMQQIFTPQQLMTFVDVFAQIKQQAESTAGCSNA